MAALAGGCGGDVPIATTGEYKNVQSAQLPEPQAIDALNRARPYVIGPFDRLSVDVFGVDGMSNRNVQANASGEISFPLVGIVPASGLTPFQLEERIAERLADGFIRDPQVSVSLVESKSQIVTLEGEVSKPGLYPVIGNMTLLQAVATAEGLEEFARDEILIFREVDGQKYVGVYDIAGIRAGNYADPAVYGGDLVVVGESAQKRRFDRLLEAAPAFLSPLVFLVR